MVNSLLSTPERQADPVDSSAYRPKSLSPRPKQDSPRGSAETPPHPVGPAAPPRGLGSQLSRSHLCYPPLAQALGLVQLPLCELGFKELSHQHLAEKWGFSPSSSLSHK